MLWGLCQNQWFDTAPKRYSRQVVAWREERRLSVLLRLGEHIQFGRLALGLVAQRVGHDDVLVVLHLVVGLLATRRSFEHQYLAVEHAQYAAGLVVTVLAPQVVLRQLVGAVGMDGEHGLDARAVGGREGALIGAGDEVRSMLSIEAVSWATLVVSLSAVLGAVFWSVQEDISAMAASPQIIQFFFILLVLITNFFVYGAASSAMACKSK